MGRLELGLGLLLYEILLAQYDALVPRGLAKVTQTQTTTAPLHPRGVHCGSGTSLYSAEETSVDTNINTNGPVFSVNITERTNTCLDFDVILDALRQTAVTTLGKELTNHRYADNLEEARLNYAMVEQIASTLASFPLHNKMNVFPLLQVSLEEFRF